MWRQGGVAGRSTVQRPQAGTSTPGPSRTTTSAPHFQLHAPGSHGGTANSLWSTPLPFVRVPWTGDPLRLPAASARGGSSRTTNGADAAEVSWPSERNTHKTPPRTITGAFGAWGVHNDPAYSPRPAPLLERLRRSAYLAPTRVVGPPGPAVGRNPAASIADPAPAPQLPSPPVAQPQHGGTPGTPRGASPQATSNSQGTMAAAPKKRRRGRRGGAKRNKSRRAAAAREAAAAQRGRSPSPGPVQAPGASAWNNVSPRPSGAFSRPSSAKQNGVEAGSKKPVSASRAVVGGCH